MAEPITHVFDPKVGLPLDVRTVVDDSNTITYPYVGQMFFDKAQNGFYYIDELVDGGAGYTKRSIFLSESNALGNLTVATLTASELFLLSDGRAKTDAESIEDAVSTLSMLKPLEYVKTTSDGSRYRDAGFIAQDLRKTPLSHLVSEDFHVRYNPLIAYLVRAVQELDGRVRHLESENAHLKATAHR